MTKYSFIIPFRDRHEHLIITRQRIAEVMSSSGIDYEIIVVEQDDQNKFRRANLLNEGARAAHGDILIFHDVDYYPAHGAGEPEFGPVEYWDGASDVYLPVKFVQFVNNDLTPRDPNDIPGGYRHFKNGVDDNFFGGVTTFKKDAFYRINGFSVRFVGWGFEDADLRHRVEMARLTVQRSHGNVFYALSHKDSGPAHTDPDFQRNMYLAQQKPQTDIHDGILCKWAPRVLEVPDTKWVRWLKVTQFEAPVQPVSPILSTTFDFDD